MRVPTCPMDAQTASLLVQTLGGGGGDHYTMGPTRLAVILILPHFTYSQALSVTSEKSLCSRDLGECEGEEWQQR